MWNPFKKNNSQSDDDQPKMGMIQRLAMKKLERMSPEERDKLMQKALNPENVAKNKDQILAAMEKMKASGQATDEQIEMAKRKFGL